MPENARVRFVQQQGFREASPHACEFRYPALMIQPRLVGILLVVGVLLQEAWFFFALGAVLAWSAVLPRLNPFDVVYNAVASGREGWPSLPPAPGPRRFAQGLAGTLMLMIGAAQLSGLHWIVAALEVFLLLAVAALVFGKFCLGSYLFLHLTGRASFARRTAPWA